MSVVGMLSTSSVLYNVQCTLYNAEYIFNVIHYYEPRGVSCRYAQVSNAPRMLNLFASLLFSQILHEICTTKAHQQSICFTLRSHNYCTKSAKIKKHTNNGSTTEMTITQQQQQHNDMTSTKTTTTMT